jgi:hypothetical protein
MPALNHTAFPELVEIGVKDCTCRATRKRPFKKGDVLYHFTGMRHKNCRRLMTVPCRSAIDITITRKVVLLEGVPLLTEDADELARRDGFAGLRSFLLWFLPGRKRVFRGQLITWDPAEATYRS